MVMVRRYDRRQFLTLGAAAVAALAAACSRRPSPDKTPTAPAAGATSTAPAAGPSPLTSPGADRGAVGLRWFGQSMFLMTSPGGTKVALDPFNDIGYPMPAPLGADLTTITHEHPDHNNGPLGGDEVVRGLTQDGWNDVDRTVGDVRVRAVRSYHDDAQGARFGRNAIFVFETGGVRIVHLGDLGHRLDDSHVRQLGGPVDVLMVPVGGVFTIDAAGATDAVARLQPRLVFPMHYKTPALRTALNTVDEFLRGKTVRRTGTTTARIARDALPAETTVMVLDYV
jgi:L-ascorbate metabolism protein UlaG (beta-lactamase superfamily)